MLIGDHRLHQLVLADRGAALRVHRGVGDGFVECTLRGPHGEGGDVYATAGQRRHRRLVPDLLRPAVQIVPIADHLAWRAADTDTDPVLARVLSASEEILPTVP